MIEVDFEVLGWEIRVGGGILFKIGNLGGKVGLGYGSGVVNEFNMGLSLLFVCGWFRGRLGS